MKTKKLRPLTKMQLQTLALCYYGELQIAAPLRRGVRQYIEIWSGGVNITGRMRSIRNRRLVRSNFQNGLLVGFIVTPAGIAELTLHPEALDG